MPQDDRHVAMAVHIRSWSRWPNARTCALGDPTVDHGNGVFAARTATLIGLINQHPVRDAADLSLAIDTGQHTLGNCNLLSLA